MVRDCFTTMDIEALRESGGWLPLLKKYLGEEKW
jgi:hypothetical protein